MKEILLSQGKVAIVDDEDYEYLGKFKWHAMQRHGLWYAARTVWLDGKKTTIYIHQVILNTPKGMFSDHKDGNGLDNRNANLRICTHSQNLQNQGKFIIGAYSHFKGVSWHCIKKKWFAQITPNRKHLTLGYFETEIEAAKTYNEAAKKYFGEFARLNMVEG